MSSHPDLPPNPREARYRRPPVNWATFPVTVLLIVACVAVAALSRLGDDKNSIHGLFFAAQPSEAELDALWAESVTEFSRKFAINLEDGKSAQDRLEKFTEQIEAGGIPEELKQDFHARLQRHSFAGIMRGEVWRLVTPMFIHLGIIHLLFNMMWLWDLGRALEARFRALRFILLVVAVSLASNITQALVSHNDFGGMSGVVYGLFGFVFMRQKFHPAGDVPLNPQIVPFMLIWLVVCFTGVVSNVANGAHVAGLISGGVIGWVNAMLGGGWAVMKRRREFQRTLAGSDSALHTCVVCKKTENDDPNLDFRIGHDGEEYCTGHLPPAGDGAKHS